MQTYVVDRTRAVDAPAVRVEPAELRAVERDPGDQARQREEWRWVPDPSEVELPARSAGPDPGLSGVIRALVWATLHPWG